MKLYQGSPWAGTEEAFHVAAQAYEQIEARMAANLEPVTVGDKPNYTVENGTAIINIKGPLVNRDLPDEIANFAGLTTYPSLQRSFYAAANDKSVERVILDVDSGGGQVSGLFDTKEALIALKSVKPVATYAGETMASGAYWLGSFADTITASPVAAVGSIGVIAVHIESKAAAESEGYKPYVIRAGAKKHLGHELESFSEEARAEMQRALDFTHNNFMQDVASNRGMSFASVAAGIGDGRVFYGQESLDVGLVDRLGSFSSLMQAWQDKGVQPVINRSGFTADAPDIDLLAQTNHGEEITMNLEEAMVEIGRLNSEKAAHESALATAEAKVATLEAEKLQLEASNKAMAGALAEANTNNEAFADTLKANIEAKACALGMKVLMPDNLSNLQAMNAQLESEFKNSFPAGGVAAVANSNGEVSIEEAPLWLKRVKK